VLGGLSGTFTADEIETLVITAADAVGAGTTMPDSLPPTEQPATYRTAGQPPKPNFRAV
jgi:hypothetical protein